MKKVILITAVILIATNLAFSQGTAINSTGAKADSSAMLDVSSTSKGMLVPRMNKAQRLSISSPATGLLVYQTDDSTGFWYYESSKWYMLINQLSAGAGAGGGSTPLFHWDYPSETIRPLTLSNLTTSPYTVPADSVFVILNMYSYSQSAVIYVAGIVVSGGPTNYRWNEYDNMGQLEQPVFVNSGQQLSSDNNSRVVNGYLIKKNGIRPITKSQLLATNYTVPADSILVITSVYSYNSYNISINGKDVLLGLSNYRYNYTPEKGSLESPLYASEGQVIAAGNNNLSFNGYLRPKIIVAGGGSSPAGCAAAGAGETLINYNGCLYVKNNDETGTYLWSNALSACSGLGAGWYLPEKTELNILFENWDNNGSLCRGATCPLTGFGSSATYWSSTASSGTQAWKQDFGTGSQSAGYKADDFNIRCVRR